MVLRMTMASTTLKNFIGHWQLFLLGSLLSVSPVLEAAATDSPTTTGVTSSGTISAASGQATSTASATTAMSQPSTTTQVSTTASSQTATSIIPNSTSPSATPPLSSTALSGSPATTQSMSTSTGATSPVTSSTGMNSSMSTTSMGNTTSGMTGTTARNNSSTSMISCHSFMCNYSDCYSMYKSQNASMCPSGYNYCELTRQTDICYTVSCSASCSMRCVNASQSNCSVNCCYSTDCLNDTFASMMMTTTTSMMTTTTSPTTTSATTTTTMAAPTTQAGNKCHGGQCNGTECYKTFNTHQVCSSSQPHCQLKKETVGTNLQWTAGCTTNCSGQTSCKASTQPPCHLECCNATLTSCLWLNGTLNVPSFATRGPQLHSELFSSVLFVFAMSLMF